MSAVPEVYPINSSGCGRELGEGSVLQNAYLSISQVGVSTCFLFFFFLLSFPCIEGALQTKLCYAELMLHFHTVSAVCSAVFVLQAF